MAFTLPWTINKLVSTNINDADSITGAFGNVSLKVNGKTQLVDDTVIEGRVGIGKAVSPTYTLDVNGSINGTEVNTPALNLTGKNNLGVVKNITGATTLTFADGEYINLQNTTSYTVLLPLATASSIGARFVFFFSSSPLAGTKTIQRSGTQFIYLPESGGITTSILMSPSTDFCIELVCVGSSGTCWSMTRQGLNTGLVAYLGGPNVFTNLNTFQGGITASATQTIDFGTNNVTMGGNNISNVVKTFSDQSISGIKSFTTAIDALKITPTSRLELSNNKYISGATTLNWGDAQNIIFNSNGDYTVTLPSAIIGAPLSRVGARFTFAFASAFSGTKIVQVSGGNQYIYDGGTVLNTGAIALTRASQHYVELLCVNYSAANICWSIVGKAYQYNIPSNMTFNSGITATGVQTINFGNNSPTMLGTNISGVVKTTGNESIGGIKTFTSPPVMDGGGITASSIPNNALQSTVALTNTPETITSLYTFTVGIDANTITANTIYTQTPPNNSNNTIVPNTEYIYRMIRTDDTLNNISSGDQAGQLFTTGYSNLSFGGLSNSLMTTGFDNISLGYLASSAHNGYRNIAIGTSAIASGSIYSPINNVAIGFNALTNAQNCDGNFALGAQSLGACSTGSNNFMGGYFSGGALTSGNYNCGISYGALNTVTTGERNNGIGVGCGGGISTGSFNTFLGDSTSATGDYSYCMALGAGVVCTGNNQIKIGRSFETTYIDGSFVAQNIQASSIQISGNITPNSNNTLVPTTAYIYRMIRTDDTLNNISSGDQAGQLFTTGYSNLSFGGQSNRLMTTGFDNISLGYLASTNHNGYRNVAIGTNTMSSSGLSTPNNCVAIGYSTLSNAQNCTNNVAIGPLSLNSCSTGSNNCMAGFLSGGSITSGNFNCGISYQALNTVTTGQYNNGMGVNCGAGITTGSFNTFLGDSTSATGNYSYCMALGAGVVCTGNNQIKIGRSFETTYIDGSFVAQNVQASNIQISGNIQISNNIIVGTQYYPMLMNPTNIGAATNWNSTPPAIWYGIQGFSITATVAITLPLSTSANVPNGLRIKFRRVGGTVTQILTVIASAGDQVVGTNSVTLTNAGTSVTIVPASTYQAEIYLNKTSKIWYCML